MSGQALALRPDGTLGRWLAAREGAFDRAGFAPLVRNDVLSSDREGMLELFQTLPSPSGFPVTDRTAMLVSTVYACMSKLGGAVSQLPVHQYQVNLAGERERMQPTPLWWLLNEQPAPNWTSASWKEWIVRCVCLRGDQFTQILRSTTGTPLGFRPLHPDWVLVRHDPDDIYRLRYDVYDPIAGRGFGVDQDDMLHFAGFGFDGCRSISAVQWAARTAIGNALAASDHSGRTVGEGAMPQIALTYPNKLQPDQAEMLRKSFVATYTAGKNRKMPLILTEGGLAKELSISPADLQLLELRRFEREDICQAFGVPPVMIGENEKTSSWGTGVEQITLGFVRFTLKPMLVRWEEELNRKLFRRAGQFLEFNLDALLAGDSKSEAAYFRAALGGPGNGDGWMAVDEVRKIKNLPPQGGESAIPFRAQRGKKGPNNGDSGATA
jgi:HK97 family phage portal protein